MSEFMTAEALEDMTGLTQSAAQIRWLKANRVLHWVRADGKPRVPLDKRGVPVIEAAETVVSGKIDIGVEPDFGALDAAH